MGTSAVASKMNYPVRYSFAMTFLSSINLKSSPCLAVLKSKIMSEKNSISATKLIAFQKGVYMVWVEKATWKGLKILVNRSTNVISMSQKVMNVLSGYSKNLHRFSILCDSLLAGFLISWMRDLFLCLVGLSLKPSPMGKELSSRMDTCDDES